MSGLLPRIDLISLGAHRPPEWQLGETHAIEAVPAALSKRIDQLLSLEQVKGLLFLDADIPPPTAERVAALWGRKIDAWHCGLLLGLAGQPEYLDYVSPTWMLHRDPDPGIEATSWRLSLRCALVRADALRRLGGVLPGFDTLDACSLELGYRLLARGAVVRHTPDLAPSLTESANPISRPPIRPLSAADQLRFIELTAGARWARWTLLRLLLRRQISPRGAGGLLRAAHSPPVHTGGANIEPVALPQETGGYEAQALPEISVSVVIPTLERYPHLCSLLEQLRRQTVKPLEILVVDQTPRPNRENHFERGFEDLPLRFLRSDPPGQCSSRNLAIHQSIGDAILLLDDDVEIADDFLERHLQHLAWSQAQASCGVIEEAGAGALPAAFRRSRVSDVFPAGNTLVLRSSLERSGLFDLAYERGERADADLGMRLYLSGALLRLEPSISVFHHRAPRGGLRQHRARRVTYAASRRRLLRRFLPSRTEIYRALRYWDNRQVQELLWLAAAGTASVRGGRFRKLLKAGLAVLLLPDTLIRLRARHRAAQRLLERHPTIPDLDPRP